MRRRHITEFPKKKRIDTDRTMLFLCHEMAGRVTALLAREIMAVMDWSVRISIRERPSLNHCTTVSVTPGGGWVIYGDYSI